MSNRTVAVANTNVHWADGTWFDLVAVRQRANEVGTLFIVDGTQSIGR
ncbi:MAG: aminotransferase class V-fold PLP-dependent enzyme [Saprospiraceae bacterium]|nr:aminotransferase class V-fold PLP-dependent enzyme [Saprospiraceae bacterium]